jgi:hypothetical protein
MTDRTNHDLAALITPAPSRGVQFSQARVLSWDNETLHNTLEWRGITITDVPIVEGINALVIRVGDIVGMLGWAPENAKGVGSWWILGKLSNPGEFVADIAVTAKIFRFVTEDGHTLAFFGKEADGDPLWMLKYGGADDTDALRIVNGNDLYANYRDGDPAWTITGTEGSQIFRIRDQAGNEMFSTNGATNGVGMADPWIPYLMQPTTDAQQLGTTYLPATTNAAMTTIWRGFNPVYHPRVTYGFPLVATGTAGWQFRMNTGSGAVTVASSAGGDPATGTVSVPGFGTTFTPGNQVEFIVNANNTGGGTTHIGVDRMYGRQS